MIIQAMNTTVTPSSAAALHGVAPLPHLGVIKVEGEDAAKFLHGQLTQDFALLGMAEARLAAFCSAKGRMQASFIGFKRSATEVWLVGSRDILPAALKRLSMFVLRAKARLSDVSAEVQLFGLTGDGLLPAGATPWAKEDRGAATLVHLYPADAQPRALWAAPLGEPVPAGPALSIDLWQWGEVRSGIALISQPVVEAFVPQMLNYESVGGVNFKKGCYPGQEVVARSQFRGTLKRRAYLVHGNSPLNPGQEVFDAGEASQPCGLVVQAAAAPDGGWDALVSVQISAAEAGALRLGAADGTPLALQPLPYPLLQDI